MPPTAIGTQNTYKNRPKSVTCLFKNYSENYSGLYYCNLL